MRSPPPPSTGLVSVMTGPLQRLALLQQTAVVHVSAAERTDGQTDAFKGEEGQSRKGRRKKERKKSQFYFLRRPENSV